LTGVYTLDGDITRFCH